MSLLQKNSYKLQSGIINIILFSCIIYFSYHIINGNRGLIALISIKEENEIKKKIVQELTEEIEKLNHKVSIIKNDNIDLDMLDEQIRKVLGYYYHGEVIYKYNE